jgi:hypothetical protein
MRVAVEFEITESCTVRGVDRYDLRSYPLGLERIECTRQYPPLLRFLVNVNSGDSPFSTFGCKAWSAKEAGSATEPCVFASRVDLIFLREATNFGRGPLEDLARRLAELLEREPGEALHAELRIAPAKFTGENRGFCLRLLLYARGATPEQAQMRWGLGLARLQQAVLFVGRVLRQEVNAAN